MYSLMIFRSPQTWAFSTLLSSASSLTALAWRAALASALLFKLRSSSLFFLSYSSSSVSSGRTACVCLQQLNRMRRIRTRPCHPRLF